MAVNPKLFAQGSFGCAFRPAIPCIKKSNLKNKISKVLTTKNANNEYAEYSRIAMADPRKKYYLGKPQKCPMTEANFKAHIEQSGCRILQPNTSSTDYEILQYEDGGFDLDDFVVNHLTKFLAPNKQRQTDLFWLNAHSLFMGLKTFSENNILHDDLKPQNIVFKYDLVKDTMEFNFIDFGLMSDLASLTTDILNGNKDRPFHWSRPLEQGFLKTGTVQYYTNLYNYRDDVIINAYTVHIGNIILNKIMANSFNINPISMILTMKYTEDIKCPNTSLIVRERIKSCIEGIMKYRATPAELIQKTIQTTDTFSMGFTLNLVANNMLKKQALNDDEYGRLHNFFEKLFDFNLFTRMSDINSIISEYESILLLNGVLGRLGKRFRDNAIIKDTRRIRVNAMPQLSLAQAQLAAASSPAVLNNVALKPCPPDKERNPATRRCIKMCPPGKTRRNGRCVNNP